MILTMKNYKITKILLTTFVFTLYYASNVHCTIMQMDTSTKKSDSNKILLTLDTSEADEVLAILALRSEGKPIGIEEWQKLFTTNPYKRLKERETNIAQRFHDSTRTFTDQNFKQFVLSDDLLKRALELRATLEAWKKTDLHAAAERILEYLPDSATIRAKVFPVIKPRSNSFVWETSTNPAIFLYIDPKVTRDKFANTVAHELHHIGLASVNSRYEKIISSLPEKARTVAGWMGAFGEGMAMLAAAGSPDIHPHAMSTESERARWDHDMANFNNNLKAVDTFFVDILNGQLAGQDSIEKKGSSFFGVQGPWYTVGYKMCVVVEKRFGRAALIRTMLDPRRLLVLYNKVAEEENDAGKNRLPLWSESILEHVGAK